LQRQREILPNPDGRPPRIEDDQESDEPHENEEEQDYDDDIPDDRLPEHDVPLLHEQLHPPFDPLPHDQYIDLDSPAVSEADWERVQNWMRFLDKQEMRTCARCKECWFDIKLADGIFKRCEKADKDYDGSSNNCFLMSVDNKMDPGPVPADLPVLTDIEQMLVSPVHISMQMAHVKGAQFRYKGHVMTFLRDVPDVVNVLPRLPRHCQVVIIRPKQVLVDGGSEEEGTTRQFRRSFTVRRWAVQVSLSFASPDSTLQKKPPPCKICADH
jgi:hypothetical protein